ncbi:M3 family oligoendopeptidase, partial [Candidatus Woesearchaeota archaeon]|nr:M3 family oligoendopeptidase [Candidatus Woesearchaeota archaeon]
IETEFSFEFQPDKTRKPQLIKTSSELHAFRTSQDPKEREESYVTELKKYKENIDKFFIIYQAIVKDWVFESNLRGYNSSISMRNFENHIPDKAIETLLEVCSENIDIFHRYFKFKAKELGMKKLRRFDVYSHIKKKEKKISFNDAKKLVLDTFEKFSPSFAEKARKIINANHIDSHPSSVKVGGAFCYTIAPDIIPYVFLNYNGTLREVATLAHELGHGIHSLFASHQSFSSQHANLPLCETASTFGEMILFERLFAEAESDEEKKSMLSDKLAESYGSIIRQNYFIKFEILAHEAIKKGTNLEELSELYFKTLKEQFGDSLEIDPLFRYEWAYISHIVHSPFYCYAYNFGELLSMALYSRYKKEGPSFIPKIEKILAYGGSKNPQEVLKEIGIDITSKEFWQGSFELIRGWQDQLEGL